LGGALASDLIGGGTGLGGDGGVDLPTVGILRLDDLLVTSRGSAARLEVAAVVLASDPFVLRRANTRQALFHPGADGAQILRRQGGREEQHAEEKKKR
jgi:hypothetical protein